jgi:hypothetical protein
MPTPAMVTASAIKMFFSFIARSVLAPGAVVRLIASALCARSRPDIQPIPTGGGNFT